MRLAAIALCAALAGCVAISTEFRPYEGRSNVFEGQGGTKAIVDGMEIWDGQPPRRFEVLGVLKDERPGAIIPMAMLRGSMVKEARARGGDALIDMGGATQITGTFSSGFASANAYGNTAYGSGFGSTTALRRNYSTFAVIRYLPQ